MWDGTLCDMDVQFCMQYASEGTAQPADEERYLQNQVPTPNRVANTLHSLSSSNPLG